MAVVLGLVAAFGWGCTDVLTRFAGRATGAYNALFYGQLPALLLISLWLAVDATVASRIAAAPPLAWGAALLCSPLIQAGTFAIFRGLMVGKVGIVAPVAASYGAITTILSALSGEALSGMTIVGIAASVVGVALAAIPARRSADAAERSSPASPHRAGIAWALTASLCFGIGFWLQGTYAVPALGELLPVWLYYVIGTVLMVALAAPTRQSLKPPPVGAMPAILGTGFLSFVGFAALSLGLGTGEVAVVTVMSSMASAVTTLLGRVLLHERLAPHQWVGITAIIAGLVLINGGR